jgi:hypothetical protein
MSGGQRNGYRPAVGEAQHYRPPASGSGADRHQVGHALIQRRRLGHRVGQPGAALVKPHQPTAKTSSARTGGSRVSPLDLQVRGQPWHHHQIGPFTDHAYTTQA